MLKHHLIVVDRNKIVATGIASLFRDKSAKTHVDVIYYASPLELLNDLAQYPKNTKIIFAYQFESDNGLELAANLHEAGYMNLCLYTGKPLDRLNIPSYLKAVYKGDINCPEKISEWFWK